MEPKAPTPNISPEASVPSSSLEHQEVSTPNPEIAPSIAQPEKDPFSHERTVESQPRAVIPTQQSQATVAPPSQVKTSDDNTTQDDATVLTVAADDDKIEKEWVSKAKNIIEQTKSDPYLQEEKVSELQADYVQKRYNKKVKLSSD